MSIPGFATPETTRAFAERFADQYKKNGFTLLGNTDLTVSRIGFGTYRCHQENEQHSAAIKLAFQKGCNLIDTSANYTDGNAEVLIGDVINQEVVWGDALRREDLVIVSKVGYIQGENMGIALDMEKKDTPFPEVVKYQQGLWHCIHPKFIEDQITRSLARMHLDTLDIYLLHNPEYYLSHALRQGKDTPENIRKTFYDRIRRAFVQMEKLVREGLIRNYGISSNGFPLSEEANEYVSLAQVWKAYQDACLQCGISPAEGHFSVIQLPYNWLENGAAVQKNNEYQGERYSTLGLAEALGLGVLVNRPLNAIKDNQLHRLARYGFKEDVDYQGEFEQARQQLADKEQEILNLIKQQNIDVTVQGTTLSNLFQSSLKLQRLAGQPQDISRFREVIEHYFAPVVGYASKILSQQLEPDTQKESAELLKGYQSSFASTVSALQHHFDKQNYNRLRYLPVRFGHLYPELGESLSFSQKALLIAGNTPGVDVVLNGMRTPAYVQDAMGALKTGTEVSVKGLI